jgi:hypothetical protein
VTSGEGILEEASWSRYLEEAPGRGILGEASGRRHLGGGIWEPSWRHPEASGRHFLEVSGRHLGGIWRHLGASGRRGIWRHLGSIWRHLEASGRHLGGIWMHLGGIWRHLGVIWRPEQLGGKMKKNMRGVHFSENYLVLLTRWVE